jgi:acyl-CoA synthetase (NDP forming)
MFSPNSIAVIGASTDPSKWGCWLAEYIVQHDKIRRVYLVNPRAAVIHGRQSLATIKEIPEQLDLAIVVVPAKHFEKTIDELLDHGVQTIVGISADVTEDILKKCNDAGVTFIGPNCAGIWDSYSPLHCLPIADFRPGPVSLISQSGGVIVDLGHRLDEVGLGYSKVVSIGNHNNCVNDLIRAMDADVHTKVIAIYAESALQPLPTDTKKPVIVMMPMVTEASIRAARSHTNSTPVKSHYVRTLREFAASIQFLLSGQRVIGDRVVVLTDTGGMGVLLAAEVESCGLRMNPLSQNLKNKLHVLPQVVLNNPIDLVGIESAYTTPMVKAFGVLQDADEVDSIIVVVMTDEGVTRDISYALDMAENIKKPTVFVCKNFNTPGTFALLKERVPVYKDIETAVNVLCG